MNTVETVVSIIMGVLSLAACTYAAYRHGYGKGFDRAMELVDEMRQRVQERKEQEIDPSRLLYAIWGRCRLPYWPADEETAVLSLDSRDSQDDKELLDAIRECAKTYHGQKESTAEEQGTQEILAKFLPIAWETAGHDRSKMAALLTDAPVLGEYFDIDSPEVRAVMEHEQK